MASTSASYVQKNFKYDVFLSFRGEDTRKNFVDHLYHALHQKGIITYKDDEKIPKGERINEQLIRSIEESRFYIIVFSKNYASSSWCLEELVNIIECQEMIDHTVYPIFYDVEPTEIRNQSGAVGEAFEKHVGKEACGRWRDALKEAAGFAGWELKNTVDGHEAKFIQQIITHISLKLSFINWGVEENVVGMETRVKNVVSSLEIGIEDVRMIGIKGMGGGGKTTLAQAVFNHIASWFEGISFVENVREVSKNSLSGLKELQKQILSDVLNDQSIVIKSVFDGKNKMKKMIDGTKVLVVLDDVDNISQLEALAGKPHWYKPGSRFIITTRDEQVLIAQRVHYIHDVNLLSNDEAICLFSKYAFEREVPFQGYEHLSKNVVHYAAGLPLTIKILGSHLCGRTKPEWVDAIERLKTIPLKETLEKLELSYNGLEDDQKEIFLDVVCILKGEKKNKAIRILQSCGFNAEIGLRVLEQKSLISISNEYRLSCHDHIEEMGRNIVRRLHPNEPSRHSRLWIKKEIEDIFVNESGTKASRSIKLKPTDIDPTIIMKGLRNMKELRLLYMDNDFSRYFLENDEVQHLKDHKVSQYLSDALRSLCWHEYPFRSLPETFQASNLVNLEMNRSNIYELWKGGERKVLKNLKFLDLRYSKLKTIDLSMTPHLEMLNLDKCTDFVELHIPVECPNLKFLNLSYSKVSYLNLGRTPHLEGLYLEGCSYFQEIHAPVGCLKNLVDFNFQACLYFAYIRVDKEHDSAHLDSAATFEIDIGCVDECPFHLKYNLPWFTFSCEYDEPRSSSSGNFEKLLSLGPCPCKNLELYSATICGLQYLRVLTLEGSIPHDLSRFETLEMLSLDKQQFQHLPDTIFLLKRLKSLHLSMCFLLEQLPENICELECLEIFCVRKCESLRDIPNNICKLKCLKRLELTDCRNIKKLPEELGSLECLEELYIKRTNIMHLPYSIHQMKDLRIYGSREQLKSYSWQNPIAASSG